jgi:hypothetical protein
LQEQADTVKPALGPFAHEAPKWVADLQPTGHIQRQQSVSLFTQTTTETEQSSDSSITLCSLIAAVSKFSLGSLTCQRKRKSFF